MSSSTPQNDSSSPDAGATPAGADRRNPLGFSDVRADAAASEARSRVPAVAPLGFVPATAVSPSADNVPGAFPGAVTGTGPGFRTEISFRREHRHAAVRAEVPFGGRTDGQPSLGHAESHAFDPEPVAEAPAEDAHQVDGSSPAHVAEPEKTPFYKREITFGRKKDVPRPEPVVEAVTPAAAPEESESVPFFKRELSFKRRRPVALESVPELEPDEIEVVPFGGPSAEGDVSPSSEPVALDEPVAEDEPGYGLEPADVPAYALVDEPALALVEDDEPAFADEEPLAEPAVAWDLPESNVIEMPTAHAAGAPDPVEAWGVAEDEATDGPVSYEPVSYEPVSYEPVSYEPVSYEPAAYDTVDLDLDLDLDLADDDLSAVEPEDEPVAAVEPEADEVHEVHEVHDASEDALPEPAAAARPGGKGKRSVRVSRGKGTPKPKRGRAVGGLGKGRRIVGLKIGASQIAAAVVVENEGRHELVQLVRTDLEHGLVVDGEVRNPEELAAVLRRFFEEHELPKTNVRIGVASNRIGVRTLDIPGIDDAERFDNAVRFRAHEVLPVAFHESVLDYRVVDERPTETGESAKKVLLVVAPRDQVEPYIKVCEAAGIRLGAIDLEALGLLRAFVEPQPVGSRVADDTATVLVSLGHESTTLLVAGAGVCDFTRVFDWGGGALDSAIAAELEVSDARATEILHHLSLTGRGRDLEGLSSEDRARATEVVRTRLTPFARELVSSLQFYQTQPDSLGIGEIVITGGGSHLDGLAEVLNQMIGVAVRHGDPLARVIAQTAPSDELQARIGSMAVPIGLAIDDAPWRTVNLLPQELRQARRKRPGTLVLAAPAVAAVSLAALGFAFFNAHGDASSQRKQLQAVQAEIAALPEPQRATIDPALQGAEAARAQAVATVLGSRLAWERVMSDLSRVLPANVWLEHLTAQAATTSQIAVSAAPGTPAPATGTGVTLQGYTFTQADVALLLARLQATPSLKNVSLESTDTTEVSGKKVVSFSIVADLNGGSQ